MSEITITDALVGEHGVIYALLAHLEQASFGSAEAARAAAALLAAGLATHAQIEDELSFVPLEAHLGPGGGPLAVMRMEHEEVEGTLARLQEVEDVEKARTLAAHLAKTAREHFAKEEQVLFPMAEQLLAGHELRRLGEDWARRRLGA
jgi:hemerythrin-like domain-containing protein